jgi:hypothetical protein
MSTYTVGNSFTSHNPVTASLPTFSAPRGGIKFIPLDKNGSPIGAPVITSGTLTWDIIKLSYPRQSGRTTMMLRAAASAKARGERIMIWATNQQHASTMLFMGEKLGLERRDFSVYKPKWIHAGMMRGTTHFVDHYTEENNPDIWDDLDDPFGDVSDALDDMIYAMTNLGTVAKDASSILAATNVS